jgi:hypothetical protein
MRRAAIIALLAVAALLGGCGSGDREAGDLANRIGPRLNSFWGYAFAGLERDGDRLIIYRKPNTDLDATVREWAGEVEVDFRNAPWSLDDLRPLVDRVHADRQHWAEQKILIRYVTTRPDGTGVTVVAQTDDLAAAQTAFALTYDARVTVAPPATSGIVPA